MKNIEGQKVPDVTFRTRIDDDWKDVSTKDIFAGKTVVVFALPGAYTPTCSSSHLPRYNELAPAFKERGVDTVVCLSVNDGFVMSEWGKAQNAERILFIPDGNGDFSEGMGALVDKRALGFGRRSWRYSMLVKDGTIEKMFIEPERDGDPFDVSDADTMLKFLDPKAKSPHDIVMFTKPGCSHCARAKKMLTEKGWAFDEIASSPRRLRAVSTQATTPQVFIDGKHIGGADELGAFLKG